MIKNQQKRQWLLVVLWMVVIFCFSAQDSSASSELSGGFTEIFYRVVQIVLPGHFTFETASFIVRKAAHFSVYAVLGFLTFRASEGKTGRRMGITILICLMYAVSDEIHQLFVSGRSAQVMDVCIDTTGALGGLAVARLAEKTKKQKDSNH